MNKRIFISNCEGIISQNNSTLELAAYFVPEGERVLEVIKEYCYINAHITHKKDKRITQPLKMILPFLVAFGANNKEAEEFAASK